MKPINIAFTQAPLWHLPFRAWFLLASIHALISMSAWLLYTNGSSDYIHHLILSPAVWHAHEMTFGFAALVAVAFLLTAAQTWTGTRSLNGTPLIAITVLWIIIRVLLWQPDSARSYTLIIAQGGWWLCCIAVLARVLITTNNRRNYLFLPLLSTMMLLNIGMLYADMHNNTPLALHIAHTIILLFGLLISIVGGRVIPFFTAKGTNNVSIIATPKLNIAIASVSIIGIAIFMASHVINPPISPAVFMISAGLLHLLRLRYWFRRAVLAVPLLWSLHIAYGLLGIGLLVLGGSYFIASIHFSNALHIITIGTIGAMILSMMSRVSLGHTGRALIVPRTMNYAFICLFIAAFTRFILPSLTPYVDLDLTITGWNISGLFWMVALSCFTYYYAPILIKTPSRP